jgi:hypothetical protein
MSSPPLQYNVSSLTVEQYFGYYPSLALASVAIGVFGAAAVVLLIQMLLIRNPNARYVVIEVASAVSAHNVFRDHE